MGADRIALFGYAHVPHMVPRQKMIPEEALPGAIERFAMAEQGFAGFDVGEWIGIVGPRQMPEAHAARLGQALAASMADREVVRRLLDSGIEALSQDGRAFGAFLGQQVAVLGQIIRTANIRPE
jgi:tripartite-type tricarboxylate transporter receptor subunit TctC